MSVKAKVEEIKIERGKNTNTIKYDPVTKRPISSEGVIREDFGGTPDVGIAPQNSNLNRGAYKKMENEWDVG